MKKFNLTIIIIALLIINSHSIHAKDNNAKISITQYQELLYEYLSKKKKINSELDKRLGKISPFDFDNVGKLKNKQFVITVRENLSRYIEARKYYYDSVNDLIKSYREKMGINTGLDQRLEGTLHKKLEGLEIEYLNNFADYYEFILKHHDEIEFDAKEMLFESEELLNKHELLKTEYLNSINAYIAFYENEFSERIDMIYELKGGDK